jgi:hypothetical protein
VDLDLIDKQKWRGLGVNPGFVGAQAKPRKEDSRSNRM